MRFLSCAASAALVSILQVTLAASSPSTPQFHLSLVGDGSGDFMLDWVTSVDDKTSSVFYGGSKDNLAKKAEGTSAGNVVVTPSLSVQCWSARLSGLAALGPVVHYDLSATGGSSAKSFVVPGGAGTSMTWAIFGDMGSIALKKASGITLPALTSELAAKAYQGILNLGDLSYELVENAGDVYMQQLEPLTSVVPMHTTIGNHEMQYTIFGALPNYIRRFSGQAAGAGRASGTWSSRFYSFNAGYVHFAVIDTEVYGDQAFMTQGADGYWSASEAARSQMQQDQRDWLEYDLSRVKRKDTPFVVLCGHRPPSKIPNAITKPGNQFAAQLLPLIDQYNVDVMFFGHEHAYYSVEASIVGKYKLPPFIISGAAGNNEFIRPVSMVSMDPVFKVRKNINEYGFGYLKATADKLTWTWGQAATSSPNGASPTSTSWTLADTIEFLKKDVADPTPAGKPVSPPATPGASNATETSGSIVHGGSTTMPSSDSSKTTLAPSGQGGSTAPAASFAHQGALFFAVAMVAASVLATA
ncbi:hypothetical protein H310_02445 [Aphanomyces invadans]|uniref:Purple acid phosphatase n=1 Tax=Aphanomyces invadans TaxID=157072 RepID=A0A024UPH2_9STRA|nr:hypothetical protein H310_02445 [Aphanomyces invadans]ETW08080.1 hypothetical protein H310_02445 [Aphanomyces invadans]|eukprot:XP_008864173.1 hypothetical protein H310_02445 [Aphanomyces invadans]